MHPKSLNLSINNVNKENSFGNLHGTQPKPGKKKKYFSFNNDFYAGPQAIWKEHFQDLAHNPDLTYGFVFPLTATSIKLFPKKREKPMTEEKWMHHVLSRSLHSHQKPVSYPLGEMIRYFVGDQYTETVIFSSGLAISHWVSDHFQGYQEILETLISVHFSFLYSYMPNGTSFREEESS